MILVLIRELVPKDSLTVSFIIRDGVAYFLAMFFVSGVMPFVSSKVGLGENEAVPDPEQVELKRKKKKKRFTKDDLFDAPVDEVISRGQVAIEFNAPTPVPEVLKKLISKNIYSAPVWDPKDGCYVGFIDMVDIVKSVVELFQETDLLGEDFSELLVDNYEKNFATKNAAAVTGFFIFSFSFFFYYFFLF